MALLGRDNSEDLNYISETTPFVVTSSSHGDIIEGTGMEMNGVPGPIPSVATAPQSFTEVMDMDRPHCVERLNSLNEDVEKLFSLPEKFDLAALSSGSELVTADLSDQNVVDSPVVENKSFLDDIGVFSSHRHRAFPHQHHPLKALRSRSLKQVRPLEKPKKKKKKKRKIKTPKSFPSRSALLSPTIHEVENEDDHSMDKSSSESSGEEEDEEEGEISYHLIDTETGQEPLSSAYDLIHRPAGDGVGLGDSFDGLDSGNGVNGMNIPRLTNGADPVTFELEHQVSEESEPNDFKLDLTDDEKERKESPAIILTTPSPVHSTHPSTGAIQLPEEEKMLKQNGVKPSSSLTVPTSFSDTQMKKVWPSKQQDKVVFYFGDNESISSQKSTPKKTFYLNSSSSSRQKSDVELQSQTSVTSSQPDEEFTPRETDSNWMNVLSDNEGEPLLSQSASREGAKTLLDGSKVKFHMGADSYTNLEAADRGDNHQEVLTRKNSRSSSHKHRHHHHHEHYNREDLALRRHKGSEVKLDQKLKRVPTEPEEAMALHTADLDEMASHRLENLQGIRRHKINRKKRNAMASIVHIGKTDKAKKKFYKERKKYDHSPHEVFVELDELYVGESREYEWREKARWIKFEEDVEEGAGRWGKPHVASLSFHSLLELRRGLENGTMLLDIEATDLPSIVNHIIDSMIIHDQIKAENKGNILRTLLLKHKHVGQRESLIRRNFSYMNLRGLDRNRHQSTKHSLLKSMSSGSFRSITSQNSIHENNLMGPDPTREKLLDNGGDMKGKLEFVKVDVDNNMTSDGIHIGISPQESRQKNIQDIMRRIPAGAEATTVLVGCVDYLAKPAVAFVRLAEGKILDNLTEVPLPVRFLFLLLGPENSGMDYHEVGRSISTLMSNQHFHDVAYKAESRGELLSAINEFLDESIVLPPGDWDQKTLLPIMDMARKRARAKRKIKQKEGEKQALLAKEKKDKIPSDPLKRTGCIFGGLINDIKRRYPHYISDIRDGLNLKSLAAIIFIFFACFASCIAFGGLLSEKTYDNLGVKETVISTSLCGIVFALLAGQPLMIIGATGPVLVFEQSLYMFCKDNNIEFFTMRVWIGFWVMLISLAAVAFESSFLVRYISRFTEEIFAILISLIFIFEVIKKIDHTFKDNPLMLNYCAVNNKRNVTKNLTLSSNQNLTLYSVLNASSRHGYTMVDNITQMEDLDLDSNHYMYEFQHDDVVNQPNTALMSTILTLGTFLIAHFLRIFRNSKFLGRKARRALGDFGIVIAIILMVLLDFSIGDSVYTQKLSIEPHGRQWFVNPMGTKKRIEAYIIFGSFIPAGLFFMLLFLETQITEMILNKKEFKLKKGSGFHLDQVLIGILTFMCSLFGLPWMCPATVRTIAHVSALSVMSTHHAPGEKPKLMSVKEQRVTSFVMNAVIGISLFWESVLTAVPMAVLFGVFLYLGITALSGVQMSKRMKLLLIPVKYHPSRGFVRRVQTMKMHLFTIIQVCMLVLLLVIKSTAAALAFPLFVILLIPLRLKGLPLMFSHQELHELDQEEEDSDDEDIDDPDFYQIAHMPV